MLRSPASSFVRIAAGLAGCALLSMPIGVPAQDLPVSVLSSPNVDLTEPGLVRQIVKQGDGQWMLVGDFRRMDAVARTGIARLQADGSVDPSFANLASIDASLVQQVQLWRTAVTASCRSIACRPCCPGAATIRHSRPC